MNEVMASQIYYIRLGPKGKWAPESLKDGVLRLSYEKVPHDLCVSGDWQEVRKVLNPVRRSVAAVTSDIHQIQAYYEADEHTIFITFFAGLLYWCRPTGPVKVIGSENRQRLTVDGWRNASVGGVPLSKDRLLDDLLKVQKFQGTICKVQTRDYLLNELNDRRA